MNTPDKEIFALYYQDPLFVGWITSNNFQRITAENINKYFSLHTRILNCQRRECAACTGLIPKWESEQDIIENKLTQNPCQIYEHLRQEASAANMRMRTKIPPAFKDVLLDNLTRVRPVAREELRRYVADYPQVVPTGLYIYSAERRVGRSSVMWCVVKELLEAGKLFNGIILSTAAMFSENLIKDATTTWDHPLFDKAVTCDLLMLDDFGQENYTKAYTDKLLAILEHRNWYNMPVIVSSTRNKASWAWADGQEPDVFSKIMDTTKLIRLDDADAEAII